MSRAEPTAWDRTITTDAGADAVAARVPDVLDHVLHEAQHHLLDTRNLLAASVESCAQSV